MKVNLWRLVTVILLIGVSSFTFQNCAPVQVTDLTEAASTAKVQSIPPAPKDCSDAGKADGDIWWVPNGTSRDISKCRIGTGDQFKFFEEELEVTCKDGAVTLTGNSQRRETSQIEGTCNLDCGDRKNNETWWMSNGTSKDMVQCSLGTGNQFKVFNEEIEYICQNAEKKTTGQTRRVDTGMLEGTCNLDCGEHKNNEVWWAPNGTSKDAVQCSVGTGTQYKIFNDESEMKCQNAMAIATGQTRRTDTGKLEGTCNLDCGEKKNNEFWWKDLANSTEAKACATSLTETSTITYKNQAEYKCVNAVTSTTGHTRKEIISETGCPPLTFNNQDNIATVAYEDIYPEAGDSDYNDFVANIKVQETYNSLEQLTKIQIEYTPRLKLAGYAAQFVLVFDGQVRGREGFVSNVKDFKSLSMFEGSANIMFETFDSSGKLLSSVDKVPKDKDLVIFDNTTTAVEQKPKAVITITGLDGNTNTLKLRKGLSIQRYRTILFVTGSNNRRYDIDLSDINPTMFDSRLQPLAFFVPVNWKPPKSTVDIVVPYPLFKDHATYLYSNKPADQEPVQSKEWFNTLVDPTKVSD